MPILYLNKFLLNPSLREKNSSGAYAQRVEVLFKSNSRNELEPETEDSLLSERRILSCAVRGSAWIC